VRVLASSVSAPLSLSNLYSDCHLLDFLSRKSDICWYRCPSLGECPCRSLNIGNHKTGTSQVAKGVNASQEMLVDLFERIESFFKRLESHTELKPSEAMMDMMVKIMVEVLSVLAIVTVEIKQRRRSQFTTSDFWVLTQGFFRQILEEATGEERRRGCLEEVGQAYSGRGEDGDRRGVEDYTWHR
jgi:hypothetical protein